MSRVHSDSVLHYSYIEDGRILRRCYTFSAEMDERGIFPKVFETFGAENECTLQFDCIAPFTMALRAHATKQPNLQCFRTVVHDSHKRILWCRRFENVPVEFQDLREIACYVESPPGQLTFLRDARVYVYIEMDYSQEDEVFPER